jgi:hypothetical protein
MIMAESREHRIRNSSFWMWILLFIFLFLAGLFVYDHFHQSDRHPKAKLSSEEPTDY